MYLNYQNLPRWLEDNWLFRKLFLLRKLYLTTTWRPHYSQFAEDISIERMFPRGFKGFFVDVGCFHPKKYSNTWMLYRRGWRGINIDIDSIKIDGFNIVRPGDTNIACAVSSEEGEATYYSNGFYSLTISFDKDFVDSRKGQRYIEKKTRCRRLTTLIDESKFKNHPIDFLSVDAEGHDLEILKSLDFERYDPRLIAVEAHDPLLTDIAEKPLYQFLQSKGYCLVGWCGLTLLLANKSLQHDLAAAR